MQYKYPRTFHLPWSEGATNDDKVLDSTDHFIGKRVIITEKMDGECSTLAYNHIYARSLDSNDHPSRHWLKANFSYMTRALNPKHRICGENVYAEHSIAYKELETYFYAFSVWRKDTCLGWESTLRYLKRLHIIHAPVIYDGIWDEKLCKSIIVSATEKGEMEGYVVRVANSFKLDEFKYSLAKFVRKNHVATSDHWMYSEMKVNKLRR